MSEKCTQGGIVVAAVRQEIEISKKAWHARCLQDTANRG
jgi:hypothetical protein